MDVLIATHGRPDMLASTLRSLLIAAEQAEIGQIVVVENGGSYGAESICQSLRSTVDITLLTCEQANKSAALNVGLPHCRDGLVFMTDDDVEIPPTLLRIYEQAARGVNSGVFFGGATVAKFEQEPPVWLEEFLPLSARGTKTEVSKSPPEQFIGFNWAAFKSDLIKVGGFNPNFGPGSETGATGQESEMQRRLVRYGCKPIFLPDAAVTHMVPYERCNAQWLLKRAYRQGVEKGFIFMEKSPDNVAERLRSSRKKTILRQLKGLFVRNEQQRFKNKYYSETARGLKAGIRLTQSGDLPRPPFL